MAFFVGDKHNGPTVPQDRHADAAMSRTHRDEGNPDRRLIAESGLFDESFYFVEGPDVREAGADALEHFCIYGWREGRRPNLYFDPAWYRDVYFRRSEADRNPLVDYISAGEAAGRRPIASFDPAWYRGTYRLPAYVAPLRHFLEHRRSQRFSPNPLFDLAFYLARHGAEIGPNRDPFAHLIRCGAGRDLDPSPGFDSGAYRAASMPPLDDAPGLSAHERRVPLIHHLDAEARRAAHEKT